MLPTSRSLVSLAALASLFGALAPCALAAGALAAPQTSPAAAEREAEERVAVVLEGFVLGPDGTPAEGAVVVSSAGGQAVTDVAGSYWLEVLVPGEATSVQVTAVGRTGANLVASTSVALTASAGGTLQVGPLALSQGTGCSPSWLPTFGPAPEESISINALAVFDDGSGPALYVGGQFTGPDGNSIKRWDGTSWSPLGSGLSRDALCFCMRVHDDGSGPALYVGGFFDSAGGIPANRIARWNGTSWSAVGIWNGFSVRALEVFDSGSGPELYAGAVTGLMKWNGSAWSPLSPAMSGQVYALKVHDDGSGSALYVGGSFGTAGGTAARNIVRWNGTTWSALGGGPGGLNGQVEDLVVHDDGSGPALYAGGLFSMLGDGVTPARGVARWDGSSWSALGDGLTSPGPVNTLVSHDDGSGPALFAGGTFTSAGGVPASNLARWDGSAWSAVGAGVDGRCLALASYDEGSGPALFAGGETPGTPRVGYLKRWDGSSWSVAGVRDTGLNEAVHALATFDDGSGPALYAGGAFRVAGESSAERIARWDGTAWSEVGSGLSNDVNTLLAHDDGTGPALYAGGVFTASSDGTLLNHVARWDGTRWSPLGNTLQGDVHALAVFDDGRGPALHAGGNFITFGGGGVPRFAARWDGSAWQPLGGGPNGLVRAFAVYDDGRGPALYAAGDFLAVGGAVATRRGAHAAGRIARWNGALWESVGTGANGPVRALAVYDDGGGPVLYAGGDFTSIGGVPASHLARWKGSSWAAVEGGTNDSVRALAVHEDGKGLTLVVGGDFTLAGSVSVNRIAAWDGSAWSAMGGGMSGSVRALLGSHDGGGPALFAGGRFGRAFDSGDSYLAKWGCPDTTAPLLACPPAIDVLDPSPAGAGCVVEYQATATDALDPAPRLRFEPPSGSLFPIGTTRVRCTATDASGNQASCEFPVTVHAGAHRR